MSSELTKRVAVAVIGIPLALAVIYLGGWPLAIVLAAIAAAAAAELYRLARQRGIRPFAVAGALLATVPVLLAAALQTPVQAAAMTWAVFLATSLLLTTVAIFRRGVAGSPLAATAVTVFGALFTGGTLAYAVFLRDFATIVALPGVLPESLSGVLAAPLRTATLPTMAPLRDGAVLGAALLLLPLVLTWVSDTGAYFGGRAWGRRKLIPAVSPAKTVAGAVSGLVAATVVGALYAQLVLGAWLGLPLGVVFGVVAGAALSVVAQLGDLAESLLKREAGVKDSGALLPGHGGVLDRFDSLFFTIPASYWILIAALQPGAGP
jgi:phosphatidate cytidylyltransferase